MARRNIATRLGWGDRDSGGDDIAAVIPGSPIWWAARVVVFGKNPPIKVQEHELYCQTRLAQSLPSLQRVGLVWLVGGVMEKFFSTHDLGTGAATSLARAIKQRPAHVDQLDQKFFEEPKIEETHSKQWRALVLFLRGVANCPNPSRDAMLIAGVTLGLVFQDSTSPLTTARDAAVRHGYARRLTDRVDVQMMTRRFDGRMAKGRPPPITPEKASGVSQLLALDAQSCVTRAYSLGWTTDEIADYLNVSDKAVHSMAAGKRKGKDLLHRLTAMAHRIGPSLLDTPEDSMVDEIVDIVNGVARWPEITTTPLD